jgi:hypothetical protein
MFKRAGYSCSPFVIYESWNLVAGYHAVPAVDFFSHEYLLSSIRDVGLILYEELFSRCVTRREYRKRREGRVVVTQPRLLQ